MNNETGSIEKNGGAARIEKEARLARPDGRRARANLADQADCWRLEPHVCAACFARIVSRPEGEDGDRLYQCSNCGAAAVGHRAAVVCACGIKLRKAGPNGTTGSLVDAGLRCHANRNPTPELPALYVASYGGAQAEGDA